MQTCPCVLTHPSFLMPSDGFVSTRRGLALLLYPYPARRYRSRRPDVACTIGALRRPCLYDDPAMPAPLRPEPCLLKLPPPGKPPIEGADVDAGPDEVSGWPYRRKALAWRVVRCGSAADVDGATWENPRMLPPP